MVDISTHWNSEIIERNDRTAVAFSGRQIKFWKALHLLSSCARGNFFKRSRDSFCVWNLLNLVLSLVLWTWRLVNKETQDSICITKNFFAGFMDEFKSKLHLINLPNRISSPSCIPVTAFLIICEVSLFVSAVKYRKAIMLVTYASLASQ